MVVVVRVRVLILELEPSGDFGMSLFLAGTTIDIFGDLGF